MSTDPQSLLTTMALLVPEHLGGLHPVERALVLVIAFGPFVVLAVVVYLVRRRDLAAEGRERRRTDDSG